MGDDKYENEKLIRWGFPTDIWFHVDDLSSAHVYLRLERGSSLRIFKETGKLDHIKQALDDCLQLVKANSIEGSKQSKVSIVYTPWENLKKTGDMADGQVGFHDLKQVITVHNVERDREIINRLNKTKIVEQKHENDFQAEREEFDRELIAFKKSKAREEAKIKQQTKEANEKLKYERDYERIFEKGKQETGSIVGVQIKPTIDTKAAVAFEDDFM